MSGQLELPHPAEVAERVLRASAGPCIVLVEESHEADVRFANNSATTDGVRTDRRVTAVRVMERDGTVALGTARRSGAVDVDALVRDAEELATPAADPAPLLEGDAATDFGDDAPSTDLGALDGVLDGLTGAFAHAASSATVLSGFAEHRISTTYLASSTGLRCRHVQPTGALQLVGRCEARSAWAGSGTPWLCDINVDDLEREVLHGLERAERGFDIPAGRLEVVLSPSAVADLMMFLVDAAGGTQAEEGRTAFSSRGGRTRVGERLTALPFDLWSDPLARDLECCPFLATSASGANVSVFDNGMSLDSTHWLRAGRLERLMYHRAGAARSGTRPTPPVDNLLLALPGATGSFADLVARTKRALLVTCLWYIREVDPKTLLLTGLTRDGVYVVEDGKIIGAANNFRFNESPLDVLARATEASETVRTLGREGASWLNRTAMPGLRIPDFNMSSVSQAV